MYQSVWLISCGYYPPTGMHESKYDIFPKLRLDFKFLSTNDSRSGARNIQEQQVDALYHFPKMIWHSDIALK